MDVEEIAKLVKIPSFSDIVTGRIAVESMGMNFKTIFTKEASMRVPRTLTQIVTHLHTDQMPAIIETVFVPDIIAYKAKVIYRQYGLKPRVIPWQNFRRTFHYNRGVEVLSSAMEFSDFVIVGESAEQKLLVDHYSGICPHGIVVRTPWRDTREEPISIPPKGWFLADNNASFNVPKHVLPKICPTLRDLDLDKHIYRAVFGHVHTNTPKYV